MNTLARGLSRVPVRAIGALVVVLSLTGCKPAPTGPDITLQVMDLTVGTGATVVVGSLVTVNYNLWLFDSTKLDNKGTLAQSTAGTAPFQVYIGLGQAIEGWDLGLPGMKVGGVRQLIVPPELGYGLVGAPGIPPEATLIFEITLVNVQ